MLTLPDVEATLKQLAHERPVFHSEADFQHALAWLLRERFPDVAVRLEYPLPSEGGRAYADVWLPTPEGPVVVELKYWKQALRATVAGEEFSLPFQSAQDIGRYDLIKDLTRVERLVADGIASRGAVIAVTNDHLYWTAPERRTNDAEFRLHEGRRLGGKLCWGPNTGEGSRRGRDADLTLLRDYKVAWQRYSTVGRGRFTEFRYLFLSVE